MGLADGVDEPLVRLARDNVTTHSYTRCFPPASVFINDSDPLMLSRGRWFQQLELQRRCRAWARQARAVRGSSLLLQHSVEGVGGRRLGECLSMSFLAVSPILISAVQHKCGLG